MKLKVVAISLFCSLFFVNCKKEKSFDASIPDVLSTNRDTTISPADDFFMYANGGWFKKNPIPDSERSNGIFRTIQDTINNQIKQICEKSAAEKSTTKGSNVQKIGDFYASGMDTLAINKNGISILKPFLSKIDAVSDVNSLMTEMANLHKMGVGAGFSFYVSQDDKNSTKYAVFLGQGGLGLGNRDYYFNTDAETVKIRTEYVKHLSKMNGFLGFDAVTSQKNAASIMNLEIALAKASRKLADLRDPFLNYNKISMADFSKKSTNLNWTATIKNLGILKADSVIVGQPEFYTAFNNLVKQVSIADWKIYLKWNLINTYSDFVGSDIEKQNFYFYSTILSGVTKQKPRWKLVVDQTNGSLGELIGQVYIKDYLPQGSKEKLLEIGNNIRDVYAQHIKKLDWMSEPTKKKALEKLSKIVMKVGYPDKWKDLSSIEISRNSYCANIMQVQKWGFNEMVQKFGKPVDRTEWGMQPQTYNAYYNPSNNEIVVPACNIIVPGFEGRMPDDAVLYGIIGGSTFGHEITHGFDDQGSKYDDKGNLKNWWTAQDLEKFNAKTKLIVSQFNKFEALPKKFVNGDATQGENIADLGGVVMGFEAFKKTKQFTENLKVGGFMPSQRYFLSYAYAWMVNIKKEALANQIMTDVHAPAHYRINGPLANIPEFYEAFKIKKGDKMFQDSKDRVSIW